MPQIGLDYVDIEPSAQPTNLISPGTSILFRSDVYFDHRHGVIGIRPRI